MPEPRREGSGAHSRTTELETLRERLKTGGYDVDPRLVAAAILERLSAGGVAPRDRKQSRTPDR